MKTKRCRDCQQTKPIDLFNRDHKSADGWKLTCRACQRLSFAKWKAAKLGERDVGAHLDAVVSR